MADRMHGKHQPVSMHTNWLFKIPIGINGNHAVCFCRPKGDAALRALGPRTVDEFHKKNGLGARLYWVVCYKNKTIANH